jgi:hypothetical protein
MEGSSHPGCRSITVRLPKRLVEVTMPVTGITSINSTQLANVQQNLQKAQNEFKQLGQDLQSGNLTQGRPTSSLSRNRSPAPESRGPDCSEQAGRRGGVASEPVDYRRADRHSICIAPWDPSAAGAQSVGAGSASRQPGGGTAGLRNHVADLAAVHQQRRIRQRWRDTSNADKCERLGCGESAAIRVRLRSASAGRDSRAARRR